MIFMSLRQLRFLFGSMDYDKLECLIMLMHHMMWCGPSWAFWFILMFGHINSTQSGHQFLWHHHVHISRGNSCFPNHMSKYFVVTSSCIRLIMSCCVLDFGSIKLFSHFEAYVPWFEGYIPYRMHYSVITTLFSHV